MESRLDAGEMQEMEQVQEQVQVMDADVVPESAVAVSENAEVRRGSNGQFLPGQSGNPSGKKKSTQEELDALEEIRKLAPGVAAKMTELLNAPKVPAIAKVRILEIILERTYGKAETAIKVNADVQSNEAARARLEAIAARIRLEVD